MFDKIVMIFDYIWGIPLTIIIVLAGIYFSCCTKFLQLNIKKILKYVLTIIIKFSILNKSAEMGA